MTTNSQNKLKYLYDHLRPGKPIRYQNLAELGISNDLAVYYVKSGWLKRLGQGIYVKPGSKLDLNDSIKLLQETNEGLHVGGKSALEWNGIVHYLNLKSKIHLYSWNMAKIPEWFSNEFPNEYHRKRLFTEPPNRPLYVSPFANNENLPLASEPERAVLELLDEVGVRQTLTEAEEILESAHNLRSDVMASLLRKCTSIKTVRLFLSIASKLSLPTYDALKDNRFPTGSTSNWVSSNRSKRMVLKP